jgi:hypothetical protein
MPPYVHKTNRRCEALRRRKPHVCIRYSNVKHPRRVYGRSGRLCLATSRKLNKIGRHYCAKYTKGGRRRGGNSGALLKRAWVNAHAAGRNHIIKADFK